MLLIFTVVCSSNKEKAVDQDAPKVTPTINYSNEQSIFTLSWISNIDEGLVKENTAALESYAQTYIDTMINNDTMIRQIGSWKRV